MNSATGSIFDEITDILSVTAGHPCAQKEAQEIMQVVNDDPQRARELTRQRAQGVPLPILTGHVHFMGMDLLFEPGTLMARPETELLAQTAIRLLNEAHVTDPLVADIGCGMGNLTCALATAILSLRVHAVDIEDRCASLTQKNIDACSLGDRAVVHQGDMFSPLKELHLEGVFDMIVSNPPYISTQRLDTDRAQLLHYEPRTAFDGGPFGITIQMRLIKESLLFLRPGGLLLFEFGLGQDRQVRALFGRTHGYDPVELAENAACEPRVVIGQKTRT